MDSRPTNARRPRAGPNATEPERKAKDCEDASTNAAQAERIRKARRNWQELDEAVSTVAGGHQSGQSADADGNAPVSTELTAAIAISGMRDRATGKSAGGVGEYATTEADCGRTDERERGWDSNGIEICDRYRRLQAVSTRAAGGGVLWLGSQQ